DASWPSVSERFEAPMPSENIDWAVIWMSLVVFLPSAFALVLMLFPKGQEEAMRWWALLGTAVTLAVSLGVFIQFKTDVIDCTVVATKRTEERKVRDAGSLEGRAAAKEVGALGAPNRRESWLSRYPWIDRFHIDYYLGVDGISMPLVLLTTALCFLSMIASW